MIRVLEGQNFATATEFTAALNKARLANKNEWITYVGVVAGRKVEVKSFDTGDLQIVRVDGVKAVKEFDLGPPDPDRQIERAITTSTVKP